MAFLHTFSLAPCSSFCESDPIWQSLDELETIEVSDEDFMALGPEFLKIPVDGERIGVDQATSNVISPDNAAIAEKQFTLAMSRYRGTRLAKVCEELAEMSRRARVENCFLYHSGL